jgi:excisionase family DNA binding protein
MVPSRSPTQDVKGKGGKKATRRNDGKRSGPEAERRRLIDSLYADDPGRAPDWLETRLLSTGQVATLFHVSRRSVTAWAQGRKLPYVTTPGGHRRFRVGDVRALLDAAAGAEPTRTSRVLHEHED